MKYVLIAGGCILGIGILVAVVALGFILFFTTSGVHEGTQTPQATDSFEQDIREAVERKGKEQGELIGRLDDENVSTTILENMSVKLISAEPLTNGRVTLSLRVSNEGEKEAIVSSLQHSCKVHVGENVYDIRSENRKLSAIPAGEGTDVYLIVNTSMDGKASIYVEWLNVNHRTQKEETLRTNEIHMDL